MNKLKALNWQPILLGGLWAGTDTWANVMLRCLEYSVRSIMVGIALSGVAIMALITLDTGNQTLINIVIPLAAVAWYVILDSIYEGADPFAFVALPTVTLITATTVAALHAGMNYEEILFISVSLIIPTGLVMMTGFYLAIEIMRKVSETINETFTVKKEQDTEQVAT